MQITRLHLLRVVLSALISGCATGPMWAEAKNSGAIAAPKDKALAIIYTRAGEGAAGSHFNVFANDELLQPKLTPGSFYTYLAKPGQLRLGTGPEKPHTGGEVAAGFFLGGIAGGIATMQDVKEDRLVFQTLPGQVYYVHLKQSFIHVFPQQVPAEEAEKALRKCYWVNSAPK